VADYVSKFGAVKGVALEASTGSANFAQSLREMTGWDTKLCHPGYVQRMRHDPDKSDKADSELIADLHRVGYLPEVWLGSEWIRDLRSLVRYRAQRVKAQRDVKLRIRAVLRQHRIVTPHKDLWTQAGLAWLDSVRGLPEHNQWIMQRHLRELRHVMSEICECNKRLKIVAAGDALIQKLTTKRGVGLFTALVLRAEIGTFVRFRTGKELSRFCGVSPRNASSGERQADSGMIKAGNPILKAALIEVSHALRRYDPRWHRFSEDLKARGKLGCVIVAAVANRWLRASFHEFLQFELEEQKAAEVKMAA